MSPAKIVVILIGGAAAMGAFIMLRGVLSDSAQAGNQPSFEIAPQVELPQVDVLISVRDLRVGETLSLEDFAWASWPEEALNPGQIVKDTQPEAIEDYSGYIVRIPIFEKEPILPQKIVKRGQAGIMAALVSPGMRAVALEISTETASGGFILPDDRVDVILTREVDITTSDGIVSELRSIIILENVRVLAIDQRMNAGPDSQTAIGSTATLELSPSDATLIAYGQESGDLSLSLRSLSDALASGDTVISYADNLKGNATDSARIKVFRNGRTSQANAAGE